MEGLKFYARLLWRPPRETLLFALRTVAAGLLTLYLAFLFDLEQLRESEINQKGKARKLWDIEEGKGI